MRINGRTISGVFKHDQDNPEYPGVVRVFVEVDEDVIFELPSLGATELLPFVGDEFTKLSDLIPFESQVWMIGKVIEGVLTDSGTTIFLKLTDGKVVWVDGEQWGTEVNVEDFNDVSQEFDLLPMNESD